MRKMAASSPVRFLFNFLLICVALWLVFILVSRLLALILSRLVGASVDFRVGGWKSLRDVVVKFKKGSIESVSVGEIKVSLRKSLVKLGVAFMSRDPKLQVLISDLEIVMRPSAKSTKKTKTRKKRTSGKGKWMVIVNLARFLSVYVTDFVLKTPKVTIEVKELEVDMSKDGGSKSTLFVKLHILPIVIHMGEPRFSCDLPINFSNGIAAEKSNPPFSCEELSLSCEFSHAREVGVVVKNVDIATGVVSVNLDEELLRKKKKNSADVLPQTDRVLESDVLSGVAEKPEKKQPLAALTKYISIFPEKVSFSMPKLDLRFQHLEYDLCAENNIMGIQFKSIKSQSNEEMGESTRLDLQLELSEIHLFRESGTSVLEILKVGVVSFLYIPLQPSSPVRAEVDVRLGGTQCYVIVSRLRPWLDVHISRKKRMVLREETSKPPSLEKHTKSESSAIMWTCTVSAPEMTIVFYSINGVPLYHVCSQSSHAFANNISSAGTAVHMELGELNLHMADEYQECLKESLFGVDSNSGSLVHIAKVSLDWGKKDIEGTEEDGLKNKLALSVDVTGMGIYFTFKRAESLISSAISFQSLLKRLSASGKKTQHSHGGRPSKSSGKGTRFLRFNLERCSVNFCGDSGLENTVVLDPKRVNYGTQGGRSVISTSADGTPRSANIMPTLSDGCKKLKYSVCLDIFHLSLCVNKEKQFMQVEVERARSDYQEYADEHKPFTKLSLFDMQNSKFVRRSGGHREISVCSLFSATDITVKWEPDVHLSLFELALRLKSAIYKQKLQGLGYENDVYSRADIGQRKEATLDSGHSFKQRKRESIFAVDVEMLTVSAAVGDGVDAEVQVQSIFSENARIGVLLEGLTLGFNGSRVLKSSRMQISRIPSASSGSSDSSVPASTVWDWVIQGLDVHICMPYRLQLRAIDDSIEDMLRVLKLITAAKTNIYFPMKKESSKPKKPSSTKIGTVRFSIRRLTADIEEEPIQGWLDEHYRMMKNEACELAVRLKFLDDIISKCTGSPRSAEINGSVDKRKFTYNGCEIDLEDHSAIIRLREDIYKQSFRSYYQACQKLTPSEGSGACKEGFQAGFKSSVSRMSLLSISATELDVSLKRIDGGDMGMIEVVKRLDPVCRENNIPFSRLYGCNMVLSTGSLVAQLRNYKYPLFSGTSGQCKGCIVLAQQATCFQPQVYQDVFIGRWRKVCILRSASGTTPPMKTYTDLPLYFQKAEVSFGVGYEPAFTDVSYAFTVALRRANLSVRGGDVFQNQPPKRERSLPWWDEMRNYIHGNISLIFSETRFIILASTDPYERLDKLQITSDHMEINQSDGRVHVSAKDFKFLLSSLESLVKNRSLKLPTGVPYAFLEVPSFTLEVTMDWDCESGSPLNHYIYALPIEGKPRPKIYDPFRSTSLSLRWNFTLRPSSSIGGKHYSSDMGDHNLGEETVYGTTSEDGRIPLPTVNIGHHDLAWVLKFWNLNYFPPNKLRTFSRWPRFGVPRVPRSGNLSMDKVMTEFMLRIDAAPTRIKHMPLDVDDPAKGLIFNLSKLKYELCNSRGKQKYTFECKRDPLDLVYQGLDLHTPKAFLNGEECASVAKIVKMMRKSSQSASMDRVPSEKGSNMNVPTEKHRDDGFLLSCDYFTIRRQSPKADPARLLAWQEAGRRNLEMTYVRSEFENGSESDEHARSDPSDDDGYNVVIADNCQRIFVYGLKLLWTTTNRDAVWSWVSGISKAFEPQKPSPSRQYAQRKLLEEKQTQDNSDLLQDAGDKPSSVPHGATSSSSVVAENSASLSSPLDSSTIENLSSSFDPVNMNDAEEGTRHFMVNIIEPQFNLHSQGAHGRFLLAAVSGRVLARSFHSVLQVGHKMIEQALGTGSSNIPDYQPQMTWKRMEFSAMLEHVQAHVAPTDVDPGAGIQWLPKIRKTSPKVKRTGALLERVFMPCDMYFRYTRHKGGTSDLKVKPLKELKFNSHNITAAMTARQYNVLMDVLSNLLFARLPKPRRNTLSYLVEDDDDDVEELADEVVPDGCEEVELAKVNLEHREREQKLLIDDIRNLSLAFETPEDSSVEKDGDLWIATGGRPALVQGLKRELANAKKSRKVASASLRMALQNAAQQMMEKEKNKGLSYAMRISMQINKVVWSMLADGKCFAEAEINDMIYDFDRDYQDIGVAQLTAKHLVLRNCLPNAKSETILSAWNPPPEWGKKVMLRVDAKQGVPKDGVSPLELLQVEIYPLKVHMTDVMWRLLHSYFFPEDEQDSQRRQEVWKVSTTAASKRVKKGSSNNEPSTSTNHSVKEPDISSRLSGGAIQSSDRADSSQVAKLRNPKGSPELRRTSSFDRTWEETVAESVANELVMQAQSSSLSGSKGGPATSSEQHDERPKRRLKDSKSTKSGRSSYEDKKVGKTHEEKKSQPQKVWEFRNVKICQVEVLATFESSRFVVNDLKLLMDPFYRAEFTGTWKRLISRVKKHVVWGVLKSLTGMQVKKFKDKAHGQKEPIGTGVPDSDLYLSDNDGGQTGKFDQYWPKRPGDGAGDGFVSSIRGLFNTQRRKAKKFVLRTMRGDAENDFHDEWSESDAEFSPFARQLTITKAKRLIKRHTKKFRSRAQKGSTSQQRESLPSSPRATPFGSDSSSDSSSYEDFNE